MTVPPLGPERPSGDQTCGRLTGDGYCGKPAVEHIAWTADLENGLVCAEHRAEAERQWVFYDRHPLTALCGINGPTMRWVFSWEHPPGFCAEQVAPGTLYSERYEDIPIERPVLAPDRQEAP